MGDLELTWKNKKKALLEHLKPTTKVFRDYPQEGLNFKTTKNIFIEGDNLEALKLFQLEYFNKIKMIYIDPPYNSGRKRAYRDKFTHSEWLNMMYPRLKLARSLLKDDGVIFISIDDHEVANLRKICDEIFGEENFVCQFIREAIKGGSLSKFVRETHDYVLVFAKNLKNLEFTGYKKEEMILNQKDSKGFYTKGRELNKWGAGSRREDSPSMWFSIKGPNNERIYPIRNDGSEGRWRLGKQKMEQLVKNNDIIFEKRENGSYIAYEKIRGNKSKYTQFITILKDKYINAKATQDLKKIFNLERSIFDFSKPYSLIEDLLILLNTSNTDLILDFFAGSCTTAHAILELNKEDGGNRKFIMIQLPEPCDKKSEAFKAGYKTIADIGMERIRRAANKIKKENPKYKGDLGFKVRRIVNGRPIKSGPRKQDIS